MRVCNTSAFVIQYLGVSLLFIFPVFISFKMTLTSASETSAPSTPDLAVAMETMKAALAAKQKDTPVMEMFSTLFESVVSTLFYSMLEINFFSG